MLDPDRVPVAVVTSLPTTVVTPDSASPAPVLTATPGVTPTYLLPTPDPAALPGSVTGSICYPGAFTPAMTVYVENLAGGVTELVTEPDQKTYTIAGLPPGDYVAYGLTTGTRLAALHAPAAPCRPGSACPDDNLLTFRIESGQTTAGVDLCDWFAPPGVVSASERPVQITTLQAMNVFSGPGLAYPSIGLAPARYTARVSGRNADSSWLQIEFPPADAGQVWIYSPLLRITGSPEIGTPIVDSLPAGPVPARDQFTPLRWSFTYNQRIVHFKGFIRDERRNLVNGFSILADNGTWSVLSHPTGASRHYPDVRDGEWDIVIYNPADAVGWWTLTVVRYDCPGFEEGFNAQCKQFSRLSEDKVVKVIYPDQAVITADWLCRRDCDQGLYTRAYRP